MVESVVEGSVDAGCVVVESKRKKFFKSFLHVGTYFDPIQYRNYGNYFTFTTAVAGVGPEVDFSLEILNESLHLLNLPGLIPQEHIPTPDGLPLPCQPPSQGLDGPSLPYRGFISVMS